jgi:Rrf2 family protein
MLRVSRRTDYAIRVMIALAALPEGTYIPAPHIGQQMLIPQPFLVKVVGDLKRCGLIVTAAGRTGGVSLARPAVQITLCDIVEGVEGPIILNTCLVRPGECPRDMICSAHPVWARMQALLRQEMSSITIDQLAEDGIRQGYTSQTTLLISSEQSTGNTDSTGSDPT